MVKYRVVSRPVKGNRPGRVLENMLSEVRGEILPPTRESLRAEAGPMLDHLQAVANVVVRRAQRQGFVVPREIRAELTAAHLPEELWKEVTALAQPVLSHRRGRFYFAAGVSPRREQEQNHRRLIRRTVRQLIRRQRAEAARPERRRGNRLDFIQPVKVQAESDRAWTLLSRDISPEGLRLIGTRSLLGQKVRVLIPGGPEGQAQGFLVRILWTCAIGDDLFENGGTFLEVLPADSSFNS